MMEHQDGREKQHKKNQFINAVENIQTEYHFNLDLQKEKRDGVAKVSFLWCQLKSCTSQKYNKLPRASNLIFPMVSPSRPDWLTPSWQFYIFFEACKTFKVLKPKFEKFACLLVQQLNFNLFRFDFERQRPHASPLKSTQIKISPSNVPNVICVDKLILLLSWCWKKRNNFRFLKLFSDENHYDQGFTHGLVCGPLGASWCEIFGVSLVLVRCGPNFQNKNRSWSEDRPALVRESLI